MVLPKHLFSILFVFTLILGCTRRGGLEEGSGDLTGLPPISSGPVTTTTNVVDCTAPVSGSVELGMPNTQYYLNQSVFWRLSLAGCPQYRVVPLLGNHLDNQSFDYGVDSYLAAVSFDTAQSSVLQSFRVEGLNSNGVVQSMTVLMTTTPIEILATGQPVANNPVPDSFACEINPTVNVVNVSVDANYQPVGGVYPNATFQIDTGSVNSRIVSVESLMVGQQALIEVTGIDVATTGLIHSVAINLLRPGYIPVTAKVAAASDSSVTRTCSGNIYVHPVPVVPPVPVEAPSCTLQITENSIRAGQDITVRLLATGLVDTAKIEATSINLENPVLTLTAEGVGNHSIAGLVVGPGGTGNCEMVYQVMPNMSVAVGGYHTCAIVEGNVKCWGYNAYGEVGDGTNVSRYIPTQVSGFSTTSQAVRLSAGVYHSCAITSGGGAKCWGYNQYGRLGNNNTTSQNTPANVYGLDSGVTDISGYEYHTCAVQNGAAKCWGHGGSGRLGHNSASNSSVPVPVYNLTENVKAIATSSSHSCALMEEGSVKCWGYNAYGNLGNGSTTESRVPVDVTGLASGVTKIAAAYHQSCAVQNGALKCWGYNAHGELGDNSATNRRVPTIVYGLDSGVKDVAMGHYHTCALMDSGELKCWGYNANGQVGDGSYAGSRIPVNVMSNVLQVSANNQTTCAIQKMNETTPEKAYCWGYNGYGALGNNSTTGSTTPFQVYHSYLTN